MTFQIDFAPIGKRVPCDEPVSIFRAAQKAGIGINSICGGEGTCGKCIVKNKAEHASEVTANERALLTSSALKQAYRLACQTIVSGDARVYIPASSLTAEQKMQIAGIERRIPVSSPVHKYFLELSQVSLTDIRSDLRRVGEALKDKYGGDVTKVDIQVLRALGPMLREGGWSVTVTVREGEVIALESGDTTSRSIGLAIDLGTTKVALYLVDLLSGETIEARGLMNPQIAYGEDVVSRIEAIMTDASILDRLRKDVMIAIDETVETMCQKHGLRAKDILELSLVGNTAMHHIFLGLPTRQLTLSPFVPIVTTPLTLKARDVGFHAAPGGYLYLLPCIAGFVGSDLVAVLLAADFADHKRCRLAIDLGTNTEIALQVRDQLLVCSCACGPAFEGAHIDFGMRAAPGAIERVRIDDSTLEVRIATVGNQAPLGLCGSGILDGIAELLRVGLLDSRGKLKPEGRGIRATEDGRSLEFVLVSKKEGNESRDITLGEQDIQQIQLAKGAIRAGIDILLEEAEIEAQDLDEVIVAGAFGSYLDPLNAIRVGLLPNLPLPKIHFVGNAAGVGAKLALISERERQEAITLAHRARYIELAGHSHFTRRFAAALRLDDSVDL